jgi:adenylate cyclase
VPQHFPLDYSDLGKREVKGFEEPVQVYSVGVKAGTQVPSPEPAVSEDALSPRPKRQWTAIAIALVLLVVGALAWWQPWKPKFEPASMGDMAFPLPDKPSIAVLPFTNMSGDPEQGYFADGMTDSIITDLSKISDLFVVARNSTFAYKGKLETLRLHTKARRRTSVRLVGT